MSLVTANCTSTKGGIIMKAIVRKYSVALVKESAHKYADIPTSLNTPEKVVKYADSVLNFDRLPVENFVLVPVDNKLKPLGVFVVTVGTVDASIVSSRDVFQAALLCNASSIFILHNHPSGDPTPSKEDIEVTDRLKKAGELMNIPLLDHVIVGEKKYYSIKGRKLK